MEQTRNREHDSLHQSCPGQIYAKGTCHLQWRQPHHAWRKKYGYYHSPTFLADILGHAGLYSYPLSHCHRPIAYTDFEEATQSLRWENTFLYQYSAWYPYPIDPYQSTFGRATRERGVEQRRDFEHEYGITKRKCPATPDDQSYQLWESGRIFFRIIYFRAWTKHVYEWNIQCISAVRQHQTYQLHLWK